MMSVEVFKVPVVIFPAVALIAIEPPSSVSRLGLVIISAVVTFTPDKFTEAPKLLISLSMIKSPELTMTVPKLGSCKLSSGLTVIPVTSL